MPLVEPVDALLAVDIGNTRIGVGVWDSDGLHDARRCAADQPEQYAAALEEAWRAVGGRRRDGNFAPQNKRPYRPKLKNHLSYRLAGGSRRTFATAQGWFAERCPRRPTNWVGARKCRQTARHAPAQRAARTARSNAAAYLSRAVVRFREPQKRSVRAWGSTAN